MARRRRGGSSAGAAAPAAFIFGGANSANIRAYSRAYHTYFHSRGHCCSVNAFYVTLFVFPVNMWYTFFGVEELLRAQHQCRSPPAPQSGCRRSTLAEPRGLRSAGAVAPVALPPPPKRARLAQV
jgi:hypothetical protein